MLVGCGDAAAPTDDSVGDPTSSDTAEESVAEHVENVSLTDAQYADITASRSAVTPIDRPSLRIAGTKAVYDEVYGAYFFSVTDNGVWEDLTPSLEGYEAAYRMPLEKGKKANVLMKNEPVTVVVYNDTEYMELPVLFTSLPVMALATKQLSTEWHYHDEGERYNKRYDEEGELIPYDPYAAPPTDPENPIGLYETLCDMTLLDAEAEAHGYENGLESLARAHIRGRSSLNYPKNSFKVELLEEGDNNVLVERDETLLGMRSDGDWNLNGMYAEPSKVRDKVAAEVWRNITADRSYEGVSTGYRTEYIEVIINNRYHGTYLMTERIDRKQLGLDDGDYMYFSEGDITSSRYQEFYNVERDDDMTVGACSLEYPKERTEPYDEWELLGDLRKLFQNTPPKLFKETADELVNVDSLIDYELFVQVAAATDNLIQNTFYVARQQDDGSYEFTFVPWDMDQTFGNRWYGADSPLLTYEDYWYSVETELNFWVSKRFKHEDAADFNNRLKERYAALRDADILSEETIVKMMNLSYKELTESGAWERNKTRWPEGGYSRNLAQLRSYVGDHMKYLDRLYDYN